MQEEKKKKDKDDKITDVANPNDEMPVGKILRAEISSEPNITDIIDYSLSEVVYLIAMFLFLFKLEYCLTTYLSYTIILVSYSYRRKISMIYLLPKWQICTSKRKLLKVYIKLV